MNDLIKALQIFRKYGNPQFPTHCEHDILHVGIEYNKVNKEDREELSRLSFDKDEYGTFRSYRFGSA